MTDSDRIASLWLATLGELATLASHEIRNPLNGALLNTAVVRQRAAKDAISPAEIAPFAESAATELERVTALIEALLALARPVSTRVDIWMTAEQLTTLLDAVASKNGGSVVCHRAGNGPAICPLTSELVRALLSAGMLRALGPANSGTVRCEVHCDASAIRVTLATASGENIEWEPGLRAIAEREGIALVAARGETEIVFSTT